jgi:hypothetical protein
MGGEQKFAKLGTHGMDPALGFPEERVFLWESPRYPTGVGPDHSRVRDRSCVVRFEATEYRVTSLDFSEFNPCPHSLGRVKSSILANRFCGSCSSSLVLCWDAKGAAVLRSRRGSPLC